MSEQKHAPTPYRADISDRLSDGSDCWVIDGEAGSIAEMMCPADVEEATAKFIVRACNSYDDLLKACQRLLQFNEDLCVDVGVSKHYPSAEFARAAIKKAIGDTQQ